MCCCLVVLVGLSCSSPRPTPEEILLDGVVTEDEYRVALDHVGECVESQGVEFEYSLDRDQTVAMTVTGAGRDVEELLDECVARHVGDVELVWADQNAPLPEKEAVFYNEVVSCVERELGVEFGYVEARNTGGVDTSVTDAAIAADPVLYDRCFDQAISRRE